MNYEEACGVIKGVSDLGSKPGLESVTRLCALLGDPQDKLRFIHVAGTNGKGSTCVFASGVLRAAGFKTGLYMSPYLEDYRDSFFIDGKNISKTAFAKIVTDVWEKAEQLAATGVFVTEFEILTACAFLWFYNENCDVVVLETGMGGRLDATNIIKKPLASIITAISIDHTAYLGDTVEKITREKCGIIKYGGVTVSYPLQHDTVFEIIKQAAKEKGNKFVTPDTGKLEITYSSLEGSRFAYCGKEYFTALPGLHQVLNTLTVIETVNLLRENGLSISEEAVKKGISKAYIAARQEVLCREPLVMLDGSHNLQGITALADTVKMNLKDRRIAVVMGILRDKQYEQCIEIMSSLCGIFIAVKPDNPRALDERDAAEVARRFCDSVAASDDFKEALKAAVSYSKEDGAVIICGSLYMAADMRCAVKELFNN